MAQTGVKTLRKLKELQLWSGSSRATRRLSRNKRRNPYGGNANRMRVWAGLIRPEPLAVPRKSFKGLYVGSAVKLKTVNSLGRA